ncbi:class I SAM-dependent rRNA methyltransferase [bacterium]|nr:MAG: class I SAM-dependent rRNA methyltransferase [bacterium]
MEKLQLKKKLEKRFLHGHDWVFSNELEAGFKHLESGSLAEVFDSQGRFAAVGFVNPNSLISFRALSRHQEPITKEFLKKKLESAIHLRKRLIKTSDSFRLVYAESDGLPGLLVDQYNDVLSVQINAAGMEVFKDDIVSLLDELVQPKAIVLRNDHYHRKLEQLPEEQGMAKGSEEDAKTMMQEHGLFYEVDVLSGQKTGLYLDQRDNRFWFRNLIEPNSRVFDGFCNEGGFALNAKKAGAGEVIAADIAEHVLERARANAQRNNLEVDFRKIDLMKSNLDISELGTFDVVNLDPPNFTRNRKTVPVALQGYTKMHRLGMQLLKPDGFLVTASCSHHIMEDAFIDTVRKAAYKEGRTLKMIFKSTHAADHPIHPNMPETEYLKLFAFQVG